MSGVMDRTTEALHPVARIEITLTSDGRWGVTTEHGGRWDSTCGLVDARGLLDKVLPRAMREALEYREQITRT